MSKPFVVQNLHDLVLDLGVADLCGLKPACLLSSNTDVWALKLNNAMQWHINLHILVYVGKDSNKILNKNLNCRIALHCKS